jgi:hypothetical protein
VRPAEEGGDAGRGRSETTLAVSLSRLLSGTYAIDVHESVEDGAASVACGEITDEPAEDADEGGGETGDDDDGDDAEDDEGTGDGGDDSGDDSGDQGGGSDGNSGSGRADSSS